MCRLTSLPAILTLVLLAGCGESKSPPANSPAPPYQPSAGQPVTGQPITKQPPYDQQAPEPQAAGTTSPEEPEASAEEMPAEEKEAIGEEEAVENAAPATTGDEGQGSAESTDDAEPAASKKPAQSSGKQSSGKFLRGLSSSLGRALSKAASAANSDEDARPAPDLADDPFPNGEPVDNNVKDKS